MYQLLPARLAKKSCELSANLSVYNHQQPPRFTFIAPFLKRQSKQGSLPPTASHAIVDKQHPLQKQHLDVTAPHDCRTCYCIIACVKQWSVENPIIHATNAGPVKAILKYWRFIGKVKLMGYTRLYGADNTIWPVNVETNPTCFELSTVRMECHTALPELGAPPRSHR